jgi:hypothetical protein
MYDQGRSQPPKLGGQIEKKSFGGAKIKKNNKIWGKILIFLIVFLIFFFFLGEPWGLGGRPPQAPRWLRPCV